MSGTSRHHPLRTRPWVPPRERGALRELVAGRVGERFADEFSMLGIPLVATVTLLATPAWIGIINAGLLVSPLLVSLPAGLWADRVSPRKLMILGASLRLIALAAITTVWALGWLSAMWLLALVVVAGGAATLYQVSSASAVPAIVTPGTLRAANSRIDAGGNTASVVGPLVGGTIARTLAPPLIPLAGAFAMLATSISAWLLPEPRRAVHASPPSIGEGLRYVWAHPLHRRILLRGSASNVGLVTIVTLFPVAVIRVLHYDAFTFGVLLAVSGAGGVFGAAIGPMLARRFGDGGVVAITALAAGVFAFGYPLSLLLARPWDLIALMIADTLAFSASVAYGVAQRTLRQEICPPHMQGRMNASMHFAILGSAPLGALLGGALATAASVQTAFWVGAGVMCASAAIIVFSPLWGMREVPPP